MGLISAHGAPPARRAARATAHCAARYVRRGRSPDLLRSLRASGRPGRSGHGSLRRTIRAGAGAHLISALRASARRAARATAHCAARYVRARAFTSISAHCAPPARRAARAMAHAAARYVRRGRSPLVAAVVGRALLDERREPLRGVGGGRRSDDGVGLAREVRLERLFEARVHEPLRRRRARPAARPPGAPRALPPRRAPGRRGRRS